MTPAQEKSYAIARQAVIGSGGRIVREFDLPNGTRRVVFDGVDAAKLRTTLEVMIPDSTFTTISQEEYHERQDPLHPAC